MSEKVRKELRQIDKIMIPSLTVFFIVIAVLIPAGSGRTAAVIMAVILIPLVLLATWYRYHFFPAKIGFAESGIYLKTAKGKQKFMPWQRISGFSKNGEYLLYSCWYLYGANDSIRLFSEAREEAKNYWEKYCKQTERAKRDKQQQIRKQIFAVGFFFILSMILTLYYIMIQHDLIIVYTLLIASVMLAFVIILLIHNHRKFNETPDSILEER